MPGKKTSRFPGWRRSFSASLAIQECKASSTGKPSAARAMASANRIGIGRRAKRWAEEYAATWPGTAVERIPSEGMIANPASRKNSGEAPDGATPLELIAYTWFESAS